jgi:sarcosine oxidase, subunit gamma
MPERLMRQPALGGAQLAPRGIRLGERALGKIDLRGQPAERAFMSGVGRVLDLLLPIEPNTAATKNRVTALWLGPDQWLLVCPADDSALFMNSLQEALADSHCAITDVSDGRTALSLEGPSAREVLAKGCPLDLHPRAFPPGSCAQTLVGKADVLLHLRADEPAAGASFDLYVGRSFAHYLWSWLEDAGREYGVQVDAP